MAILIQNTQRESRLTTIPQEFAIIDSQAVDATSLVLKHEASIVDPRRENRLMGNLVKKHGLLLVI